LLPDGVEPVSAETLFITKLAEVFIGKFRILFPSDGC
jgi:hypothetical protein